MITTLVLFIIYFIYFRHERKKALIELDTYLLGRIERAKRIRKINKKTSLHIIGYSIGSVFVVLIIFFLYTYFYFPIEYTIQSNSVQESVVLSGVQYDENTLFYVAKDTIEGKAQYYYFTLKDNERWMETLNIEHCKIEVIDENQTPEIKKKVITYSIIPTYRNQLLTFLIHDFGFNHLEYFQPNQEDMNQKDIQEEEYIIKIPSNEIPQIDIETLRFPFKR